MIDTVYQIVKTVLNKELRGNLVPDEFNKLAKQAQDTIFNNYFVDANLYKNKQNKGLINTNHANLSQQIRQKINQFNSIDNLAYDDINENFTMPDDLFYINDNGLLYNNNVIEEAQASEFGFLSSSCAAPSETFPVFEEYKGFIKVYPSTIIDSVSCRYLRKPLDPKWTYTVVLGTEMFNNAIVDFQDFELHVSEMPNLVIEILSLSGINIRETEVAQYAEALKRIVEVKKQ